MDIEVLGIDLSKTVCSLAGLDASGTVVYRKRLQLHRLLDFLEGLDPCIVAMEACGGAHHIGRFCLQHGHEPRLMSPLYVRPYVKVHKSDNRDTEAATRPTMSFVAIKSEEPLDLQALHRARERLVTERTRLINQGRDFLMERGIRVGAGRHIFQKELVRLVATGTAELSHRILSMLSDMMAELATINDRVEAIATEIKALAKADADMQRLMEIPGVGPTIASALLAAVGTGSSFANGRDLSAWLGLVPRQITTGGNAGTRTDQWRASCCSHRPGTHAHDSGAILGKRAIGGGRRLLRHVMSQSALVASHHNPVLKTFADRLRAAGKPHKFVITAVARKLVTIVNALCKSSQKWAVPAS